MTIARQPSCSDHDPAELTVEAARLRIDASIEALTCSERVALRSALGRVLAQPLLAPFALPRRDNSAMDGYALNSADLPDSGERVLRVSGTAWAGKPYSCSVGSGECVRIMTGAELPEGTDTVVMQEHVERDGDDIRLGPDHAPGDNVRPAGEDVQEGQVVLVPGRRLAPADLGLIAALGWVEVPVYRRLRVAFFSTGDELRSLGEPLTAGAIYDSNRYTLYGALTRLGVELIDLGVVTDERSALHAALQNAASCSDVIVSTGGASVGDADFVLETLTALGRLDFWKVAMKPGRPLTFGSIANARFFGLPGNPVSVMATFYQFVQPALRKMMGETDTTVLTLKARCSESLRKKPGRMEFQRGILSIDPDGQAVVRSTGAQGSGLLRSMSAANCFILLPRDAGRIEPGTIVDVQPFVGFV
jgi:molybdopterin molybdotransferase